MSGSYFCSLEEVVPEEEAEEWGSEESIGEEIEDAGAQNMSSDEDFVIEDEEGEKSKAPTSEQAIKNCENSESKEDAGTHSVIPQKRKADDANIVQECKQAAAVAATSPSVRGDDDSCSIAIQTAPPKLKKKRRKQSLVTENKNTAVSQTGANVAPQTGSAGVSSVVPRTTLPKTVQINQQNVAHIPAGVKTVQEKKVVDFTAKIFASVNTNVKVSNTVTAGAVSTMGAVPPAGAATAQKSISTTQTLPKLPVILNVSSSTLSKPSSVVGVPSSHTGNTIPGTVSKTLSSAAVTSVPGVGKVMLVSSSGVPLQVLKAVPVSQIQGKTMNTSVLNTQGNIRTIPVCVVSSSSSLRNSAGVTTVASTSPQLASSSIPKVSISHAPAKISSVLPSAKQPSQVSTTSASPLRPPVLLVQRPVAGGVVPLAVKGGAIVVPARSASQQVVVIAPSSSLTSSTTSSTTQLSGTGISVLGNTQIAQTALGQKVILPASVLTAAKTLSHLEPKAKIVSTSKPVALADKTPSEPKGASLPQDNNPVAVTTTTAPNIKTTTATTASVTAATLVTSSADSKPTSTALPVAIEQIKPELTAPNKQLTNAGPDRVSDTVTQALTSNCDTAVKLTDTQTLSTASQDTQTVSTVSPATNLEQQNSTCNSDKSLPSVDSSKNCQPETTDGGNIDDKTQTDFQEKEQLEDTKNGSDPLVDLTCYETSVTDSAGCEESNDSAPNGLHPHLKTSLPSKLTDTDAKRCNGVSQSVTTDTKSEKEEVDSVERNHAIVEQTTNGVVTNET